MLRKVLKKPVLLELSLHTSSSKTLLGTPFFESFLKPCLGPCLGTWLENVAWEPWLGICSWEPVPGNLSFKPVLGNLAWKLQQCGFGLLQPARIFFSLAARYKRCKLSIFKEARSIQGRYPGVFRVSKAIQGYPKVSKNIRR